MSDGDDATGTDDDAAPAAQASDDAGGDAGDEGILQLTDPQIAAVEPAAMEPAAPAAAQDDEFAAAALDAGDFEQFAADVGAVDLPDILEAAAVYSATVMGQDSFSRPRLLHLAAEAVDDLSREDGLRGFGQLLREGTLRKVSRGTFALGNASRYQAEAERRAG